MTDGNVVTIQSSGKRQLESSSLSEIKARINTLFSELASTMPPVDVNIPTGQNLTVAFLARLAEKAPGAATDEEKLAFEKLCRKVDVAKKVWIAYDRGWAKPTDKTPLPASTWPLLATAFLYHATQLPTSDDNIRGLILKLINSAFNAVELGRKAGAGNMKTVADLAEAQLREILAT